MRAPIVTNAKESSRLRCCRLHGADVPGDLEWLFAFSNVEVDHETWAVCIVRVVVGWIELMHERELVARFMKALGVDPSLLLERDANFALNGVDVEVSGINTENVVSPVWSTSGGTDQSVAMALDVDRIRGVRDVRLGHQSDIWLAIGVR